jgi:uncharacterized protein YpuA (DUF1002 family)
MNDNGGQMDQAEGRRAFLTRMAAVTGVIAVPAIVSFGVQNAAAAPAGKGVPASTMGASSNMYLGCAQANFEIARLQGVLAKVDVQIATLDAKILEREANRQSTRSYTSRRQALMQFRSNTQTRLYNAQSSLVVNDC